MTPKERLARLKTTINDYGVYRQYTVSDTPFYEDIDGVEQALTELEELKRVVKEFMDLQLRPTFDVYEAKTLLELTAKLRKVGREE